MQRPQRPNPFRSGEASARTLHTSSSPPGERSASLRVTSEDTFVVPTVSPPRMPGMPGQRRILKILDGLALTRRTEFARPIPMYGLQLASTILVPLLCAAHVSEEAARL